MKNYRPITCLNAIYKIFTSMLNEQVLSEGFVFVCQESVMNILIYHQLILQTETSTSYKLCKSHQETLMHILPACLSLCQITVITLLYIYLVTLSFLFSTFS